MASRNLTFSSVEVGDELPAIVRTCTQEDIWRNAAGSLDFNPVHTDPEWCKTAQPFGIPQTVAHGMMTMSAMASVLSDWAYPVQGNIRSIDSKLVKPVPAGSTVRCTGIVSSKHWIGPGRNFVVVDLKAENQDGDTVAVAEANLVLPD